MCVMVDQCAALAATRRTKRNCNRICMRMCATMISVRADIFRRLPRRARASLRRQSTHSNRAASQGAESQIFLISPHEHGTVHVATVLMPPCRGQPPQTQSQHLQVPLWRCIRGVPCRKHHHWHCKRQALWQELDENDSCITLDASRLIQAEALPLVQRGVGGGRRRATAS